MNILLRQRSGQVGEFLVARDNSHARLPISFFLPLSCARKLLEKILRGKGRTIQTNSSPTSFTRKTPNSTIFVHILAHGLPAALHRYTIASRCTRLLGAALRGGILKPRKAVASLALVCFLPALMAGQTKEIPEWCQALPRPEYQSLQRVLASEPWFEVYKVSPGVFAIYEPHQAEEVISYLIVGHKQALLFDTGMGMGDIKKVTSKLTARPVVVLNSHTHDDHVGGNWQFSFVYGMDTEFTRTNARGSREDAQAEITPELICGALPKNFDSKTYATKPWKISRSIHDGFKIDLGGRAVEVLSTPGHTPDAISLLDRANGLLFTGDTYYPAPIWLFRPETDLDAYVASVKRLAALAPQVKLVLGAHNIPVASPDVLLRLVTAIQSVRGGAVPPQKSDGGKSLYTTEGISFLLKAGAAGGR
jgi:glyoxylase-like metal-dependent hydrolase (beta-lactamase superfamily II)